MQEAEVVELARTSGVSVARVRKVERQALTALLEAVGQKEARARFRETATAAAMRLVVAQLPATEKPRRRSGEGAGRGQAAKKARRRR